MASVPPAPTFRAPTRDSVMRQRPSLAVSHEEDLSFMTSEIKRLHRDMANMLATASPPPSSATTLHQRGSRVANNNTTLPAIRGSVGESDDDCSDDEPALSVLQDDLRNTTEKFFERHPPTNRARRRASSVTPAAEPGQDARPLGLRHEQSWHQSWNGLVDLEKCVGGMMRRQAGTASTASHQSRESAGSGSVGVPTSVAGVGDGMRLGTTSEDPPVEKYHARELVVEEGGGGGGADVDGVVHAIIGESDDEFSTWRSNGVASDGRVDARAVPAPSKSQRWLCVPATGETSGNGPESEEHSKGDDIRLREDSQGQGKAMLKDLRARSEEATRTLEALKALLVEEREAAVAAAAAAAVRRGSSERKSGQPHQARKLWPTREEKVAESTAVIPTSVEQSEYLPLVLQAMDNLQQINAKLSQELRKRSSSSVVGGPGEVHRRIGSSSSSFSRHGHEVGSSRGSHRSSQPGRQLRKMKSSSDLLERRRSAQGQAEPMSCGVPRHRIQVSNKGADLVYFELAITQARSTWTVERQIDEFFDLRKSLVETAMKLAEKAEVDAETEAAKKRQRASVSTWADGFRKDRKRRSGSGGGRDRSASEVRRGYRQEGEARVPSLSIEKPSWFERTRLGNVLSGRNREEILAEKKVLLASWLAKVLADSSLISPDLVRFLGGNTAAQPVVADVAAVGAEGVLVADGEELFESTDSESASADEFGDDSLDDSDEEDDEDDDVDLASELDSLRGSLCAPEEWAVGVRDVGSGSGGDGGSSPRERLEKAMGNRFAVARREVSPGDPRRVPGQAGSLHRTGATRMGESLEFDENRGVGSPVFMKPFALSSFAPPRRGSDRPGALQPRRPSPSSPARRVTLDAFFQAPT